MVCSLMKSLNVFVITERLAPLYIKALARLLNWFIISITEYLSLLENLTLYTEIIKVLKVYKATTKKTPVIVKSFRKSRMDGH